MNVQDGIVKIENDNFEYVLSQGDLISTDGDDQEQITEELPNVVYTGGQTVLLDGNEYYIQAGDGEMFVLNENETVENLYENGNEQPEDGAVEYVQDDGSSGVYQVGGKRLKMENGEIFALDGTERFTEELSILNQVTGSDNAIQYAVLKDGQLHLQISENDTVEIVNNQDFVDAEGHLEVQLYSENEDDGGSLDLSSIKGRNVLTGKTVCLTDYFERIAKKEDKNSMFLNQKFTIGRRSNGKFLVGKILNIKPANNGDGPSATCDKMRELIFEEPRNVLTTEMVLNNNVSESQLDFLSKTLNGLTEMPSMVKKLVGKKLDVKLVEKKIRNDGKQEKKVNNVCGFLTEQNGEGGVSYYTFNEGIYEIEDPNIKSTSLVIVTTIDERRKTTKVTFTDKNQQLTCTVCNKEFRTPSQLSRHLSMFHTDKPLICSFCNLQFEDAVSVALHRKELDHYFLCTACGKKFTSQTSLKRHMAVHDITKQLKPYECSICGKRFSEETVLLSHLVDHDETIQCGQCNKPFSNAVELNIHKKTHHPVKCYYCDTCGRQFSRHSNLLRHEEIHGGQGNLHKCNICGSSYKFISSLTRHIVQNHVKKS